MRFSIRTRLAVSFALIFTVLLVLFSGAIYYLMSTDLERELAEDTSHDIKEVLYVFASGTWESQLAEMPEESREFKLLIRVLDPQGETLYLTEGVKEWDWPVEKDLLKRASRDPVWSDREISGVSHLILTQSFVPKDKPPHFLQVANSRADINRTQNKLIFWINIGTPLILIIALFLGRFFAKKALLPVEKIRSRAETINSDNLHDRLAYDGPPDELHRLTATLNALLARIQESFEKMKRFTADASHELRIPLAGIRGTLEVGLRQKRSPEESHEIMEAAYRESERMSELVVDLLSLARADAGAIGLELTEVNIEEFLKTVFEEAELLNCEKKVTLNLGALPKGTARFDAARIHQVLMNLLENAIRYNRPGGEVHLSGSMNTDSIIFTVRDTGIGIAPDDQARVFDRFYRVDKARSREAGGTGLGLSISRSIIEAHKGTLSVRSALNQGSEFTLTIPRFPASA